MSQFRNSYQELPGFSLAFSPSCTFQEATDLLNHIFLIQLCSSQSQNSWLQGRAGDSPPALQHFRIHDYHSLTSVFNSCLAKHSLISIRPPRRAARLGLMASRNVGPILPLELIPKCVFTDTVHATSLLELSGLWYSSRGLTCPS